MSTAVQSQGYQEIAMRFNIRKILATVVFTLLIWVWRTLRLMSSLRFEFKLNVAKSVIRRFGLLFQDSPRYRWIKWF